MGFVRRQAITAALTANAIRPLPGFRAGIPAFFAGWLTGELAPHVLGLTAADAAAHLRGSRRDWRGLALAGGSAMGLAYLVRQSRAAVRDAEEALAEGLGVDYVEQLDAKPTPAELATPWRRIANPFAFGRAARRAGVEAHRNISFAPHGRRGLLDVYTSEVTPASGAPVLLQVHGGGWTIGNKDQQGLPLMHHMAAKGWVCVAINYRLAPRDPWPAQIIDVKAALAWIKDNIAEYGGDPDYVAITGGSAGGHLTALAAVTPNAPEFQPGFEDADTSVQAAVPYYGVYDWAGATGLRSAELMRDKFLAPRIARRRFADAPELFEQGLSPAPGDPGRPRLLRHPRFAGHARRPGPGPRLRRGAARHVQADRRVRRASGRPARVRRLPVDPVAAPGARDRPVPHLALELLAARTLLHGLSRTHLDRAVDAT